MEFKYIALAACAILCILLLINEFRRKNRHYLYLRMAASVVLVSCVVMLSIPVKYHGQETAVKNSINVLTSGTPQGQQIRTKGVSVTIDLDLYQSLKGRGLQYTPDLPVYLKLHPEIRHIHLYGYGLEADLLARLKAYQFSFHPAADPEGFLSASWSAELKNTAWLELQGIFKNPGKKTAVLYLQGAGTHVDSVAVQAGKSVNFDLRDQPRHLGRAVYRLVALAGKDTLSNEPVPFEVRQELPGTILMLISAPDFEFKFLKAWLSTHRYPLMLRNRISKDKFSTDFLNTTVRALERVDAQLLQKTALLIADENELMVLSSMEREAINRASAQGMGLLIRSNGGVQPGLKEFIAQIKEVPALKVQEVIPEMTQQRYRFPALPAGQTRFIQAVPGSRMLMKTIDGMGLVSSRRNGEGTLLYTVIPTTYQWVLNGQKADYSVFWSALISAGMRQTAAGSRVQSGSSFPVQLEHVRFNVETGSFQQVPEVRLGHRLLGPLQHPQYPSFWQVDDWPEHAGWNTLFVNKNKTSVYIYQASDWIAARQYERLNLNKELLKNWNKHPEPDDQVVLIQKELSLWWFYAGFLIAAAFLWYETKML